MLKRPIIQVLNSSGKDILPGLAGLWSAVSWEDAAGKKSDSATITMLGPPSLYALPARGTQLTILAGWSETGPVEQGVYTVQNWAPHGDPESGEFVDITMKAADFVDNLKQHGHKAHDAGQTFGQIVQAEAQAAGLSAIVDPSLSSIVMGYHLRWARTPIDFLHELAEMVGGTVKPAGRGKIVVMKRGGSTSGSGQALPPITIERHADYAYSCEFEPRTQHGQIGCAWTDSSGNRQTEQVSTNMEGPIYILPHPARSQAEAKQSAQAEAYERQNNTFRGQFDSPGLPFARAEAPVTLSGFGWPIDGACKAEALRSVADCNGGYLTTVNVKSGDTDKGLPQSSGASSSSSSSSGSSSSGVQEAGTVTAGSNVG